MENGAMGSDARIVRTCTVSLVACLFIILGGMACTFNLGLKCNDVDHRLYHLREDLAQRQAYLSEVNR